MAGSRLQEQADKALTKSTAHYARAMELQQKISKAQRASETRRKILIGSAGFEFLRKDEVLRKRVRGLLEAHCEKSALDARIFNLDRLDQADYVAPPPPGLSIEQRARHDAKEKKADTRRRIVMGGTLMSLMATDASLRARTLAALKESFAKKPAEISLFALDQPTTFIDGLAAGAAGRSAVRDRDEEDVLLDALEAKSEPATHPGKGTKRETSASQSAVSDAQRRGAGSENSKADPSQSLRAAGGVS